MNNDLSIIINTKNEERNIERLLVSIKNALDKYSQIKAEIILVDNFSNDKTVEIAKKFDCKIFEKGPERSAQRNYGAEQAQGRILIFLDADMELGESELIREIYSKIDEVAQVSYIIPEVSVAKTEWDKCRAYYRKFVENDTSVEAPRVFGRQNYLSVGGYDERLNACEDWDLRERMKTVTKIERLEHTIIHHESISSIYKHLKKKFYYATYLDLYSRKHGQLLNKGTVFFLRASFHKMLRNIFENPILVLGSTLLLTLETIAGLLGYIYGRTFR